MRSRACSRFARGAERETGIVELVAPERLVLRSQQGGVSAEYVYTLEPTASGSKLSLAANCEFSGAWKLLSPLISRLMARADRGQPAAFKQFAES